jgi:hypothetical protein
MVPHTLNTNSDRRSDQEVIHEMGDLTRENSEWG